MSAEWERLLGLSVAERGAELGRLSRDDLRRLLTEAPVETLLALGRQGVAALGAYRTRLTKRERVRGKMLPDQGIDLTVREKPRALRIEFVSGPGAGRRVLYDETQRAGEIRVREGGVLGFAGGVWIGLDNPLTRAETNHRATEVGFAMLLDLIERDLRAAAAHGGHTRGAQDFEPSGAFAAEFVAPPGATGLYARKCRLAFDLTRSLPVGIEVHDGEGLLEVYRYADIAPFSPPPDFFTLRAAKL
jgi:hypothetical protein